MRPLGRLAFVDHVANIRIALKDSLRVLVDSASADTSTSETGLQFEAIDIDVCLVGSTSGGTASGSLIDLAWLVREFLSNGRMLPARVTSMLLHGTSGDRQVTDLQDANTVSFLQELQHFSVPGVQRPGLSSRFSGSEMAKPFDEATFVHFGDDLAPLAFVEGVNRTAEYLELRTLTSARREMNAWRNPERTQIFESPDPHATSHPRTWRATSRAAGRSMVA